MYIERVPSEVEEGEEEGREDIPRDPTPMYSFAMTPLKYLSLSMLLLNCLFGSQSLLWGGGRSVSEYRGSEATENPHVDIFLIGM